MTGGKSARFYGGGKRQWSAMYAVSAVFPRICFTGGFRFALRAIRNAWKLEAKAALFAKLDDPISPASDTGKRPIVSHRSES
jgi:hypothetical protein